MVNGITDASFWNIVDSRQSNREMGGEPVPYGRQVFPRELYNHNYWQSSWETELERKAQGTPSKAQGKTKKKNRR